MAHGLDNKENQRTEAEAGVLPMRQEGLHLTLLLNPPVIQPDVHQIHRLTEDSRPGVHIVLRNMAAGNSGSV